MELENEENVFQGLNSMTLLQTLDTCTYNTFTCTGQTDDFAAMSMDLGEFNIQFDEEAMKTDFRETVAETAHRFAAPITENEIKDLTEDQECKNTKANTRWAVGVWRKWREERNGFNTGEIVPEFSAMDAACMDYWLQRFLMEVRNQKGKEYTPKSLYYVACSLF
jgi:hypothetical protein